MKTLTAGNLCHVVKISLHVTLRKGKSELPRAMGDMGSLLLESLICPLKVCRRSSVL